MNVCVDRRLSQVAALVTGAAQPHNFHRLDRLYDRFDSFTEVGKRRCHTNLVLRVWLFNCKWLEVFDLSRDELLCRKVLVRDDLVNAMFGAAEERVSNFAIVDRERVMHDADAALVLDRQTDEHSHCR